MTILTAARVEDLFLHAPEVECIGKCKTHRPRGQGERRHHEETFRWRVVRHHAAALTGNPYDGRCIGQHPRSLHHRCWVSRHNAPPITSSRSTRAARSAASRGRSSANSNGGPRRAVNGHLKEHHRMVHHLPCQRRCHQRCARRRRLRLSSPLASLRLLLLRILLVSASCPAHWSETEFFTDD